MTSVWPDLAATEWTTTREAIELWSQVVGKVRLALEPMLNHWWQVPLYVSARGLTTSLMHAGRFGVEIEFDFVAGELALRRSDGELRAVPLGTTSVAAFYHDAMATLRDLDVDVAIVARPVERLIATPFAKDDRTRPYDAAAARRFFGALVEIERVMTRFRGGFIGKASPVHYFWGGGDLATSRFSGRPAPRWQRVVPNCPSWVMVAAYSHEVASCGFWPGGDHPGGSFYAYGYPEPTGFRDANVTPRAAYYHDDLGEFILPYDVVRSAADPDTTLLGFFESTYAAVADLGGWDRERLEAR